MDIPVDLPNVELPQVSLPDVDLPQLKLPSNLGPLIPELAQELALAALIGGNLFARVAMGPALARITDKSERGKVLNTSWRRYGFVNSLSLAVLVGAWLPARQSELNTPWYRRRDRTGILVKDVVVGTVAATGLVSAAGGMVFAGSAPGGGVPMESGEETAAEAPRRATRIKRVLNTLGAINLGAEVALLSLGVLSRRRRTRRLLKR
jgi:hypothetical protein